MGLKDLYEDVKFKAIAKKEAVVEWYQSDKVQNRISKVKAKLKQAKEKAKKYAAEIEKSEQFQKMKEKAAPHIKHIQAKAAELKQAIADKQAAKRLRAEKTADVLSDEEADQALYNFISDKRRAEKKLAAAQRGKDKIGGNMYLFAANGDVDNFQKYFEEANDEKTSLDETGMTVLHIAAENNRLAIVEWLLENDYFEPNIRDLYGNTPLHMAATAGHTEVAKHLLVEADADIACINKWNKTALHYASEYGHVEMTDYLLFKGINVMAITKARETAYDLLGKNCRGKDKEEKLEEVRNTLLKYVELAKVEHTALNSNHEIGTREFDQAEIKLKRINRILNKHQEWLDSFIEEEVVSKDIGPDLIKAAREGRIQWIDDMLAKENVREAASDFKEEETGQTLLHAAVLNDNEDFLAILQDSTNLMPDDADKEGRTALHLASMYGLIDMAELCIDQIEDYDGDVEKFIGTEDNYGKKAMDMVCQAYIKEDKSTIRAEMEYLLDPDKAQREADEAELIRRYQEQVKLAKYYKAAHIKHPQWIMEHKHEINQTLTGLWNARKKREERRKFLEERNARRAREKAERDGLLTDLKLAVKTGNDTIDNSRKKLYDRVKTKTDRLQTVIDGIDKDVENTEFINVQGQGFLDGVNPRIEEYLHPTENVRRVARDEAIKLWKGHIKIGKRAIESVWKQYEQRIIKLESHVVETVGVKKVEAKIKAIQAQMETNRQKRKKAVKDLDNSLVIERIFVITERHKMETAEGKETPRSRRERVRQYKRIKYALDVQERQLLAEKAHLIGNRIVEQKRIAQVQYDESTQSTRRRFKRHKQLTWKKAAKALQGKYDDWKAYDKETENLRNLLKAEESIVQKKEAPLWWRKAQREKVEEIKEEIKTREKFSESFEMVIEDLISQYDQKIWSKEVRFKKRSFKRFKAFKKLHKALKTEYLKAAQDIPEEERLFDSDGGESASESTRSSDDETDDSSSDESSDSSSNDDNSDDSNTNSSSQNSNDIDSNSDDKGDASNSNNSNADESKSNSVDEDEESESDSESASDSESDDVSDVGRL